MAEMGQKPGERTGVKSNFAVTCNRLSQFIKNGRIADLGLGMAPRPQETAIGKAETFRPPTTMCFLPGADMSASGERETAGDDDGVFPGNVMELFPQSAGFGDVARKESAVREPEKSQLTIFYGGKVLVFDNFPAEKAKDLMQMASKGSSNAQNLAYVPQSTKATTALVHPNGPYKENPVSVTTPANPSAVAQGHAQKPANPYVSDLPIARKASLRSFLEKRKDRINAKAPYQRKGSSEMLAAVKQEDTQSWLGSGPQISIPSLSLNSECSR